MEKVPENSSTRPRRELTHRVISALREDPRMSVTAIAQTLDAPRALVAQTVDSLLASDTIRIVAAVNPSFLGIHVIAHVSIEPRGPVTPIAEFIASLDESVLVTSITGSHSVVAELRTRTHADLHSLLSRIRLHSNVARIDTLIYSRVRKGYHSSRNVSEVRIDDADRAMMEILQRDGRASYTSIAPHVALTPTTVRSRIQRLEDAQVIQFGVVESRGVPGRQVSVGFGINSSDSLEPLIAYLKEHSDVEFAAECVGRFDVIGTLVSKDFQTIHDRIESLLSLPSIDKFETWTHIHTHKEDYSRRV